MLDDDDVFVPNTAQTKPMNSKVRYQITLPLTSPSDTFGNTGAWRIWTGLWLAHLLRKTICSIKTIATRIAKQSSLSEEILKSIQHSQQHKGSRCAYGKALKKRGQYWTRRPGKYCWS